MPPITNIRTPMRLLEMPRRTFWRESLFFLKKVRSAAASVSGSRSSPPTTTPRSRSSRATCITCAPLLFTTWAAAIWDAPTFRPTSFFLRPTDVRRFAFGALSAFRRCSIGGCSASGLRPKSGLRSFFGFSALCSSASVSFFRPGSKSESLISFFRSTSGSRNPEAAGRRKLLLLGLEAVPLDQAEQLLRPARARERHLLVDHSAQDEIGERLLERHHPAGGSGLHDRVDLLDLRLADQVPDGVVGKQDLDGGHSAGPVRGRDECLGHHALEGGGDLRPDLSLLGGREDVDQAVDRRRGVLRVQRGEDEVAGLGGRERGRDRLEVAHLAEEDHVGVLAERAAKRVCEGRRVGADLALVDDAVLVPVEELDRVLDRDDVIRPGPVDLVD